MKPKIRIYLCDEENKRFFGEGPCRLLHAIEETGSLRSASLSMEMAYTKALQLIRNAERELGFPLTVRKTGGKGGGGSCLTPEAKEFLHEYKVYRDACIQACTALYSQSFSKQQKETSADHRKPGDRENDALK